MTLFNTIWNWFLNRHWLIKLIIVGLIISSIASIFDKSVDYQSLSVGDCVVTKPIPATDTSSVKAPTRYEIVDCSSPMATAKVKYIKEMYKQDWTLAQWQSHAESNCPELWTSFDYPVGMLADRFICWLDKSISGTKVNLLTEKIVKVD